MPRRLPVLNSPSDDQASLERPRWQWAVIGAVLVLAIFMPLSALASWMGARLATSAPGPGLAALGGAAPVLVAFAFAAWAGGAMVGRFSAAPPELPAAAGALGGASALALAALGGALRPWPVALGAAVVLVLGGALAAVLGGRFGIRRRP